MEEINKTHLEQVTEHFKNAKEVKCLSDGKTRQINILHNEVCSDGGIWFEGEKFMVKCYGDNEYAEIISYKETKPTHYKTREVNGMDVIDLVKHWQLNFNEGNVLKYLLRDKGQDIEDLEKIIDYAQRELKHLRNL